MNKIYEMDKVRYPQSTSGGGTQISEIFQKSTKHRELFFEEIV